MWRGQAGASRRFAAAVGRGGLARLYSGGRSLLYAPIANDATVARLPICLRILLENLTRQALLGADVTSQIEALVGRLAGARVGILPARVLLDAAASIPLLIDLVSLRDAVIAAAGDAAAVNPRIPVDLLIGADSGLDFRAAPAAARGSPEQRERSEFLAWCWRNFDNLRLLPSGMGDAQWLNVERLSEVVWTEIAAGGVLAYPDLLVGTHERTTAANAVGVLGWEVGGLEATATLLGKPLPLAVPQVVGVELSGRPSARAEASELARRVSDVLCRHGVAGKLVEFFGRGVETLPVPVRATVASAAPETGAMCLYFPADRRTLEYLRDTGRGHEKIRLIEQYARIQSLWPDVAARPPEYDGVVAVDLGNLGRSSGRSRSRHRTRSPEPQAAPLAPARARGSSPREGAAPREQSSRRAAAAHGSRFQWPHPGGWISRAPFFDGLSLSVPGLADVLGARPLVILGDGVGVEEISSSGEIAAGSAAADYLRAGGVSRGDPDTYAMRRGNYEVALRATFATSRLNNRLARGARGNFTALMPERVSMRVFDAASEYQRRGIPLVVIAGRRYGCGAGCDWAAKGVAALGVKAVIAASFERIHRVSLIGAGVLPLVFPEHPMRATPALDGSETFDLVDLDWSVGVRTQVRCIIRRSVGSSSQVVLRTAIETADELYYLRNGGVLPALWRERLRDWRDFETIPPRHRGQTV